MTIVDKIGNIWESEITFGFGFDPDAKGAPDIFIEGFIKEDMFDYLKAQAPKKVEEYFSVLDNGYKAAVNKINGAKAKVRSIDGRIQREKEKIQRREIMQKMRLEMLKIKLGNYKIMLMALEALMKAIVIDVVGDTPLHVSEKVGIGENGEANTAADAAMQY